MKTLKGFWVPMQWTYRGGAWIEAENQEAAIAKAEKLDCELHEAGAEIVDWEILGKAQEQK